jgi:hypothetical protein
VDWCGDILLPYTFSPFRMIPDFTSTLTSGGFGAHVLVHVYIFARLSTYPAYLILSVYLPL